MQFTPIHHIRREDASVPVFERPCLRIDPSSGKYRLYGCAELETGWAIVKFEDADDPSKFDPTSWTPVLEAERPSDEFVHVVGYKDPVIVWDGGRWHMFAIAADRVERIRRFAGPDGQTWAPVSDDPVMENAGWHNFFTRPASVVPLPVGYLFVYEGSNVNWRDPVYNIATGKAHSIEKVLEILLSYSSCAIKIKKDPERMRPSDVPILIGDCTRMKRLTGWEPVIPFEQTMLDLLNYWRQKV